MDGKSNHLGTSRGTRGRGHTPSTTRASPPAAAPTGSAIRYSRTMTGKKVKQHHDVK
uniref:Uncharacterized protein n=1 Tax=Triticum urartu TaxID=4572 RepID=A0A8R7RB57_TRIUA